MRGSFGLGVIGCPCCSPRPDALVVAAADWVIGGEYPTKPWCYRPIASSTLQPGHPQQRPWPRWSAAAPCTCCTRCSSVRQRLASISAGHLSGSAGIRLPAWRWMHGRLAAVEATDGGTRRETGSTPPVSPWPVRPPLFTCRGGLADLPLQGCSTSRLPHWSTASPAASSCRSCRHALHRGFRTVLLLG